MSDERHPGGYPCKGLTCTHHEHFDAAVKEVTEAMDELPNAIKAWKAKMLEIGMRYRAEWLKANK